jgi:hypothetical protein
MDSASNQSSIFPLVCFLAAVSVLALKGRLFGSLNRSQSLPPGPKGLPWLGPLTQIPRHEEWRTFHKWCSEYSVYLRKCARLRLIPSLESPLVSFSVLGQTTIVIDTLEKAVELFERRSVVYSSRYISDHGILIMTLTVSGQVSLCWIL